MHKILYISDCYTESPVFESQVLGYLAELRKYAQVETVYLTSQFDRRSERVLFVPPKSFTALQWRLLGRVYENAVARAGVPDVVICRGYLASMLWNAQPCSLRKSAKYIYDFRADIVSEMKSLTGLNNNVNKSFVPLIDRNIRKMLGNADAVFTVSAKLKDLVVSKYSVPEKNVHPFSTVVSEIFSPHSTNSLSREQLEFKEEEVVFCYAGGLAEWQKIDVMLSAFAAYVGAVNNGRFLIITKEKQRAEQLASELPKSVASRIKVLSARYDEVPGLLSLGDVGLLVRDRSVFNQVASPTKYGEYFNCGLSIIASDVGADYSYHAKKNPDVVTLIDSPQELAGAMLQHRVRPSRHTRSTNTVGQVVNGHMAVIASLIQ